MKKPDEHFKGTIGVSGTGKVEVAPDEAVLRLGVVSEAKTATEAVAANAKRTQEVIDAVSAEPNHGVTTSGLSMSPIRRHDPATHTSTVVGFRASNGVTVQTKVGYVGQIFDVGIKAGATQSSGIEFRVQDEGPHRDEALRIAVKTAFDEAKIVAAAAGVELLGSETIHIDSGPGRMMHRAMTLDAGATTTPTLPGDLTISAGVRIEFRTRV